ncbi:MAG: AlpA family transcriptional regulator [Desulforhopalus sp.]
MYETILLLRLSQVEKTCGLKKSSIYARIKKGTFPVPVQLGPKSVAWRSDEIGQWVESRPRAIRAEA